jgi:hypothetical protein
MTNEERQKAKVKLLKMLMNLHQGKENLKEGIPALLDMVANPGEREFLKEMVREYLSKQAEMGLHAALRSFIDRMKGGPSPWPKE